MLIMLSKVLLIMFISDIGLQLLTSKGHLPGLEIGIMNDVFHYVGKILFLQIKLKILSKLFSDDWDTFWGKENGISSGPVFLFLSEVLSSLIEKGEFTGLSEFSSSNLIVVFKVTKFWL